MRTALGALAPLVLFFIGISAARADAVVTLCHRDTEAGQGTNLAAAIKLSGTIRFDCKGPATITVTQPYALAYDTTIDGGKTVTLDAAHATSLFTVDGQVFTLTGMRITQAGKPWTTEVVEGTVIKGSGTINLADTTIDSSIFPISVGDVLNRASRGSLTVTNTTFASNVQSSVEIHGDNWRTDLEHVTFKDDPTSLIIAGGQIAITDIAIMRSSYALIAPTTTATIRRGAFSQNTALHGGWLRFACLAPPNATCTTTIANSQFTGNQGESGGAFQIFGGDVKLLAVTLSDNTASLDGGAIAFNRVSPDRHENLSITHGTFRNNTAGGNGGAVDFGNDGGRPTVLTANAVDFTGNHAGKDGGAISGNAQLLVNRGLFIGNKAAGSGGGVALQGAQATPSMFSNTLFARNGAQAGGGFSGTGATLVNTTFASNAGGALAALHTAGASSSVALANTILSSNTPENCPDDGFIVQDRGHNLQYPQRSCGAGIAVGDPLLDPLYTPVAGSPAYGKGDEDMCEAAPVSRRDVFNQWRPQGGTTCTIGAAEGLPERIVDVAIKAQGGQTGGGSPGGSGSAGPGGSGEGSAGSGGAGGTCGCQCVMMCNRGSK